MYNKKMTKSAMVTTELVIGIGLAVAVMFLAIGLFKNNLKTLVSNASLSNGFTQNESKTDYDSYNRDYTDFQINVQTMGEQGLAMLRKKANNLAIELISSPFDNTNSNGDTIEYLSLAIEAIVGKGSICTYMKKESDKFCDEDELGGYEYMLSTSGGSAITIQKTDILADYSIVLPLNSAFASFINSIPKKAEGRSAFTTEEKYEFIKKLTSAVKPHILSNAILVNDIASFKSTPVTSPQTLVLESKELINEVKMSSNMAYEKCKRHDANEDCHPAVYGSDNRKIQEILNRILSSLSEFEGNSEITKLQVATQISNHINDRLMELLGFDDVNNPTSCQILVNGLLKFVDKYELNVSDFGMYQNSQGDYILPRNEYYCSSNNN